MRTNDDVSDAGSTGYVPHRAWRNTAAPEKGHGELARDAANSLGANWRGSVPLGTDRFARRYGDTIRA